ncbi:tRNA (adenosine(37)-N6)-threonylcarbamoyltransferase complex dimerization subunit type 1 TsaB [Pseudooceanicola spongiae]|uniref:tRNA (Adenosine(37)-N6)-threonylcarbamoyltransferase complex dimerization subunit type 1 TsaB n=1 Tax=Pseudooceanicola spongiae TaxID=2613965 RepID=A0A7L9WP23_9RHOB|nr:tRNA (adenosine(37)-N6)-threonylcarbamoyltransferase complex dimerization subunit type 1 TsaB [Pseudooceanicola spongiae]QOL81584.1 tRNA (adenosine(37)-N6)-threonylcarbamoyltransferase complex dimerization subunit type 1 TsaB [Pseudooceanicola spongiae]
MPSETLILAFDTSAAHCAAALLSGDTVLSEAREEMSRGQAERLVPLLEQVLSDGGYSWSDLSALAVGTGPGNFTGIRIAVSLARGLSLALSIPAIGVTGFEALAEGQTTPHLATLPAPRDHLYGQLRDGADISAPQMFPADQIPQALHPAGALLIGAAPGATPGPANPAPAIARAARAQLSLGQPTPPPAPVYLRPADAAPPRDAPPRIIP